MLFISILAATCLFLSAETLPVLLKFQAGGNASLPSRGIPLSGSYDIIWDVNQEMLVHIENGQHKHEAPERYRGRLEVDLTGTLHITDLKVGDTGVYTGQIINGDRNVRKVSHNVIVFNPVLTTHDEGRSSESSASLTHSTLGVFVLFLLVCLEYLF